MNAQFVTVGLLPVSLYIPPPSTVALFPLKAQLVTVGLLLLLYIPPPSVALSVWVGKPFMLAVLGPLVSVRPVPLPPPSMMLSPSPAPLSVRIFVSQAMCSIYVPAATWIVSPSTAALMAA